jgi:glycosyltransferase involved in cell wall biosynthesis
MLHVVQISFFLDPQGRSPTRILEDWPSLVSTAEVVRQPGVEVTVVQACAQQASVVRNGVRYEFRTGTSNQSLIGLVRQLEPDVVHVHGLGFSKEVGALAAALPHIPLLLQDHADRVPRWWRRPSWRRAFAAASGISFCALPQAHPFHQADLIAGHTRIFEIAESTSTFSAGDYAAARRLTRLPGDPAVLWVGHLDENKDPITILNGIGAATDRYPNLHLSCYFASAPLMAQVRSRIARDARLRDKVHLSGRVEHCNVEHLMQAADAFVLGSHREGSGYSLIEALACGLPPVVTDIPSFRMLTDGGNIGALWSCGMSEQFSHALIDVLGRPRAAERKRVRRHFEAELSPHAFGRKLLTAYREIASRTVGVQLPAIG